MSEKLEPAAWIHECRDLPRLSWRQDWIETDHFNEVEQTGFVQEEVWDRDKVPLVRVSDIINKILEGRLVDLLDDHFSICRKCGNGSYCNYYHGMQAGRKSALKTLEEVDEE